MRYKKKVHWLEHYEGLSKREKMQVWRLTCEYDADSDAVFVYYIPDLNLAISCTGEANEHSTTIVMDMLESGYFE